jgi:Fe-S oxidoreductase
MVPGLAWLSERLVGFSGKRTLPRWRGDTFLAETTKVEKEGAGGISPPLANNEVVLLADTFNNYFEPDNLRAARKVLESAGYTVHVARAANDSRPLCCGRTFLATGMVDQAKHEARRTLAALKPWVERGVPIVGLEPSCLLTLRDEFLPLLPGAETEALAAKAMLFEEFLVAERKAGHLDLKLQPLPQSKALLHGHCHQKAFDAFTPVQEVLGWIPGLNVEIVDSSCCGMSGSFGFDAEHYDVSMKMGEAGLLPAVRSAAADTLILADGTSCRHQIADGSRRDAIHVAQVVANALAAKA